MGCGPLGGRTHDDHIVPGNVQKRGFCSMSKWWLEPQRMIQTNLREIDADLDPDKLISDIKSFGTTVLMFNTAGIVASYPTKLSFHYLNPYLRNDLVGEVINRCHENRIRYMARMDFGKANRVFYGGHPDWFYRTATNAVVDYNGQVHTCVNGPYQQECVPAIIEEVLDLYPIDGIFFNMFGYQTWDYSGNYHGICHCVNCQKRFRDEYGHELPKKEDPHDPVYNLHRRFRAEATRDLLQRIVDLIRSKRPDVAISGFEWIRRESNTSVDRPLPHWIYEATAQAKTVMDSWPKRAVANAAVHFLDIPYRHVSVPPYLTALRIAQNLASSAWLDFYCISTLDRQEDRLSFDLMRDLYLFHRDHSDEYYRGLEPAAKVAILSTGSMEFRGVYRALAESHIPFDALEPGSLEVCPEGYLSRYELIVVADAPDLSDAQWAILDDYVEKGGRVLTTGRLPVERQADRPEAEGSVKLKSLGIHRVREFRPNNRAAYFKLTDRSSFPSLGEVDITFLDDYYLHCDLKPNAKGYLRYVPPVMYGPPEKCYYETVTDEPGLIVQDSGKGGITACFPWPIGKLYYKHSSPAHRHLINDTVTRILGVAPQVETDASEMVEVTLYEQPGKRLMVHLVNSSGHHGTAFHAPIKMADISLSVRHNSRVKRVQALRSKTDIPFVDADGVCRFEVPRLDLVEAIALDFGKSSPM